MYQQYQLTYTKPETMHIYTPDFSLPNWIIIESRGYFKTEDRKKHLLIKKQHPDLDLRFVFYRSSTKISKQSKTTYAKWCETHGFQYADGLIPISWLQEPPTKNRVEAAIAAFGIERGASTLERVEEDETDF